MESPLDISGHTMTNMTARYQVPPEDSPKEGYEEAFYFDYENIDFSQIVYNGTGFHVPAAEMAVKIIFYSIIIVMSLIGNTLVIVVVIQNKRMRTTTNFYIVNLAVADLMVTLFSAWVQLVDDLTELWVLGPFFCKINSFTQVLAHVSSVLTLTLIACDRFFGIVFAMKAHMTERRASIFIVLVWLVSVAVSSPLIYFRRLFSRQWKNVLETWCEDDWPVVPKISGGGVEKTIGSSRVAYFTAVSVLLFFLPVLVMGIAYAMIIWRLWSSRMPGERVDTEVRVQDKLKKKVVIMLIMILSVFVICWLPYQVILLYSEHRPTQTKLPVWWIHMKFFSTYIACANSALNPIIYAGFNENFKKGFKDALSCLICVKGKRRYSAIELRQDSYHSQSLMSNTQMTSMTKV